MAEWHQYKEWAAARSYAKTILEPICAICNKTLEGNDWTIDHIIPSDPPNHDIHNLQSMCRACNGRKQNRTYVRTTWRNPRFK
jgi:5-methylcytosine-specific restriction endonuclease McrA